MSDYDKRLFAYQMAMALARSMRSKGLISAKEYAKIDTIIANKYGISSCSLYCGMDLIYDGFRGNMSHYKEVTLCQEK